MDRDRSRGGSLGIPVALALIALLSAGLALLVRAPEGAGLGLLVAVQGPRLLLALAVGAGLAVAGALADADGPHPEREILLHGMACGGAAGAAQLVARGLEGAPALAAGALAGAALFAGVLIAVRRAGALAHLLTGLFLAFMLLPAVLGAVAAKGQLADRAFVWWWLGDMGGASWATAGFAVGSVVALVVLAMARPRAAPGVPLMAFALYGIVFGTGGIVPWFGMMVPLVAAWLVGGRDHPRFLPAAAGLGALALVWADALPRLLGGGYAPPAGMAVMLVALPWFLVWGGRRAAGGSLTLRVADYAAASAIGAAGIGVAVILTLLVRILGG